MTILIRGLVEEKEMCVHFYLWPMWITERSSLLKIQIHIGGEWAKPPCKKIKIKQWKSQHAVRFRIKYRQVDNFIPLKRHWNYVSGGKKKTATGYLNRHATPPGIDCCCWRKSLSDADGPSSFPREGPLFPKLIGPLCDNLLLTADCWLLARGVWSASKELYVTVVLDWSVWGLSVAGRVYRFEEPNRIRSYTQSVADAAGTARCWDKMWLVVFANIKYSVHEMDSFHGSGPTM